MDTTQPPTETAQSQSVSLIDGTGKLTDFQCPRCDNQPLEVGVIFKYQVCFCNECLGFVIDNPTFGELVHVLRAAYNGTEDPPKMINSAELRVGLNCPTCTEPMDTHPYYGPGNVVLDSCQFCKLNWLDNDELNRIIRAEGRR